MDEGAWISFLQYKTITRLFPWLVIGGILLCVIVLVDKCMYTHLTHIGK